jgi:hypothetical protein
MTPPPQKSNLISCEPLVHILDIKLIRTDTTFDFFLSNDTVFDVSQKAEKGMT